MQPATLCLSGNMADRVPFADTPGPGRRLNGGQAKGGHSQAPLPSGEVAGGEDRGQSDDNLTSQTLVP